MRNFRMQKTIRIKTQGPEFQVQGQVQSSLLLKCTQTMAHGKSGITLSINERVEFELDYNLSKITSVTL